MSLELDTIVSLDRRDALAPPQTRSLAGQPLSDCVIVAQVVNLLPLEIEVRAILRGDREEAFYPPLRGRVLACEEGQLTPAGEKLLLSLATAEHATQERRQLMALRPHDKVVVRDGSISILKLFFEGAAEVTADDIVLAVVMDVGALATDGMVDVRLRSVADRKTGKPRLLVPAKDRNGSYRFPARLQDIRLATPQDELASCTIQPTSYDRLAILYPAWFMASVARHDWHKVRALHRGEEGADKKLNYRFGGLDALLEYRASLAERILAAAGEFGALHARRVRTTQALGYQTDAAKPDDLAASYIEQTTPPAWHPVADAGAAGRLRMYSSGDGTEWAVRAANWLFRGLHDDKEAAFAYGLHLYARDFAAFDADGGHAFHGASDDIYADDARIQLRSALLQLRRYVTADEWVHWCRGVASAMGDDKDSVAALNKLTASVSQAYRDHLYALARLVKTLAERRGVRDDKGRPLYAAVDLDGNSNEAVYEGVLQNVRLPEDLKRYATTRLYENRLLDPDVGVAAMRQLFDFERHMLAGLEHADPRELTDDDYRFVDTKYRDLREGVCDAVFYATETHATEMGALRMTMASPASRAAGFTVDDLVLSTNEWLAVFLRQALRQYRSRDLLAEDEPRAYGEALVASAAALRQYFETVSQVAALLQEKERADAFGKRARAWAGLQEGTEPLAARELAARNFPGVVDMAGFRTGVLDLHAGVFGRWFPRD